jgi:hypothetical protein
MLAALQQMDSDLDAADTSTTSSATNEAKTGVKAQSIAEPRLGGVAKLASYLVGTGYGKDIAKQTEKQREQLIKPGTSGEKPEDFNLVSEGDKGQTSATSVSQSSFMRERVGEGVKKSPSNTSEETDESVVVVRHP